MVGGLRKWQGVKIWENCKGYTKVVGVKIWEKRRGSTKVVGSLQKWEGFYEGENLGEMVGGLRKW